MSHNAPERDRDFAHEILPVILVTKKDDGGGSKLRFSTDIRALNAVTLRDVYPLPNIQDTLDQLGGARFFNTLDLESGFWQIDIDPKDREKTAFSTPDGHWEYLRLPFGLSNSPSTFHRLMDSVLSGLKGPKCLLYMDDIIVFGRDVTEHLMRLGEVYQRLRESGLKLKHTKCRFLREEVDYLGHVISADGIKPDPGKIEAIVYFLRPHNLKTMRVFLGLVGYYRRFILDFAKRSSL